MNHTLGQNRIFSYPQIIFLELLINMLVLTYVHKLWGFPGGTSGKEPACQCRKYKRCKFDPYFWLELKTKFCLGEISHDWHWALFILCAPLSTTEGGASSFYLLNRAIPLHLTFARFQIQVLAASSKQWEKGGRFLGSWSPVLSSFCRSTHWDSLACKTSPSSLTTGNTG